MQKCTEYIIKQLVREAMNDTLTAKEQSMLKDHLKECEECRSIAEQMRGAQPVRESAVYAGLTVSERIELKRGVMERIRELEVPSASAQMRGR